MSRVLLTAFEPYDGSGLNSSCEAMKSVTNLVLARVSLHALVLPVRYGVDTAAVAQGLSAFGPDILLHLGQTHRARVGIERLAVNVRTVPDEYALVREPDCPQRLIHEDGPPAYWSSLPVDRIASAIASSGVPVEVSAFAGIYLCNHVLYQSLHREAVGGGSIRVGFVHLPRLPEQVEGSDESASGCLPLDQLVTAVTSALACVAVAP